MSSWGGAGGHVAWPRGAMLVLCCGDRGWRVQRGLVFAVLLGHRPTPQMSKDDQGWVETSDGWRACGPGDRRLRGWNADPVPGSDRQRMVSACGLPWAGREALISRDQE